jgi:hypothetical protein
MFDIPSGEQQEEGKSDDSPIVLEGEKAFGFRSVLKYMYAGCVYYKVQCYGFSLKAALQGDGHADRCYPLVRPAGDHRSS